jgi:hypothetical protein
MATSQYKQPEILERLFREHRSWYNAFVGLFNGGKREGYAFSSGGLHLGKSECELSDWRDCYAHLQKLGLLTFRTEFKDNHPSVGGQRELVHIDVTERGFRMREEDLRAWRAWSRQQDEKERSA